MHQSKLIKIVEVLNKQEVKGLDLFLRSPYFNQGKQQEDIIRLWAYICQNIHKKQGTPLSKEHAYTALFPQEPIIVKKLEKLMSRLTLLIEQFIILQQQQSNPQNDLMALSNFFGERKIDTLFNQSLKKFRKQQEAKPEKNADTFYQNFLLEKKINQYQSLYNNRKTDLNLPPIHYNLDLFYLLSKLEYACQLLANHIFVVPMDYGNSLDTLDHLIPAIETQYLDFPVVQLYHSAFQLLKDYNSSNDQLFIRFNTLLEKHGGEVSAEQLKALQSLNRSYSISKFLAGNRSYLRKAFEIYRDHLAKGWLYYDGQILPGSFSNIVFTGLNLENYEWVYQFIQQHRNKIAGTDTPEIIYNYSLAHFYFHTQKYDQALEHLADTYEDRYYKIAARRLEVKIHYEQQSPLLLSKIDAYKIYIYRMADQPVSSKQRIRSRNFIDILKQIIAPKTFQNPTRIQKIMEKIHAADFLAEKEWLLEKLKKMS